MAARTVVIIILVGVPVAVKAGGICLGLVPGTEPEKVLQAGLLSLHLLEVELTLVVGTDPLLVVSKAIPGNLVDVLGRIPARPSRDRAVATLRACLEYNPSAILLITAEGPGSALVSLFPEMGRKGTKLFVLYSAKEGFPEEAVAATGGTALPFWGYRDLFLGVLEAVSRIQGRAFRRPGVWRLDPLSPVPLAPGGELYLIADAPMEAFVVSEAGQRITGELVYGGFVFIYRFRLPARPSQLVAPRYAVVEAFLSYPGKAFPWYFLVVAAGGAVALALSIRMVAGVARGQKRFVIAVQANGKRRVMRIPASGVVLGRGENPWAFKEACVEIKPVGDGLEARPLSGGVELNGSPLEGPVRLAPLDRLSFGEWEVIVLSAGREE